MATLDYSKYFAAQSEFYHRLDLALRSDNDDKQVFLDEATKAFQDAINKMPTIVFIVVTPIPATPA